MVEGIVTGKLRVTALAPLIIETAQQDDEAARQAVLWAAESLANLAKGAIRQLGLVGQHFEVVLSGSFFKAGEIIIAPMKKSILRLAPYADFLFWIFLLFAEECCLQWKRIEIWRLRREEKFKEKWRISYKDVFRKVN